MSTTMPTITPEQIKEIRAIPHLKQSIYCDLDIPKTLDFFTRCYVRPLQRHFNLAEARLADCACGYGWLSIAYIYAGGRRAIAADLHGERLEAAREIARILSVDDRIEFIRTSIQDIPLGQNSVEIFVTIETLEHVGKANMRPALERIRDVTSQGVVLTTPNKLLPVIAHDTRLPFCHWLPRAWRTVYAKAFGREDMEAGNEFLTPLDLQILKEKFRPFSSCLTFSSFEEYWNQVPLYLPYGPDERQRTRSRPRTGKAVYYRFASTMFGRSSHWIMPSLACVLVRR